jgi:hypothetical protein
VVLDGGPTSTKDVKKRKPELGDFASNTIQGKIKKVRKEMDALGNDSFNLINQIFFINTSLSNHTSRRW